MAINNLVTYTGTGAQAPIMLNRHAPSNYSVRLDFDTTGDVDVQGTLSQLNRGDAEDWFDITGLTGITADSAEKIVDTPLEAIRFVINANGSTINGRVMQSSYSVVVD